MNAKYEEIEDEWLEDPIIGVRYDPCPIYILKDLVRITWGWFFPIDDENESACYIDIYFDKNGESEFCFDYFPYKFGL